MTVLLLHPIGLDAQFWSRVDFGGTEVVRVDLPGHGRDDGAFPTSLDAAAELIGERITGRFDVIGVSLGGMLAQHLAVLQPDRVRSLVICSSSARTDARVMMERASQVEDLGMEKIIESTIVRWFGDFPVDEEALEYVRGCLRRTPPEVIASAWKAMANHDLEQQLDVLDLPITVIGGRDDPSQPVEKTMALSHRLPGSEYALVPGGHLLPLQSPAEFWTCCVNHLERVRDV